LVYRKEFLEIPESLEDQSLDAALAVFEVLGLFGILIYLPGDNFEGEAKPGFFGFFLGLFHALILAWDFGKSTTPVGYVLLAIN